MAASSCVGGDSRARSELQSWRAVLGDFMHGGVRGKGAAFKGELVQKRASEIVGYLAIGGWGLGPTLPWQVDNGLTALPDGTGPT